MAVVELDKNLEVLNKYLSLVDESLGTSSVYIRTKETLQDFFDQSSLKETDKANILSQVLVSLNTSLVNASMSTALDWAKFEKELFLRAEELAKDLDLKDKQIQLADKDLALKDKDLLIKDKELELAGHQANKMEAESIATQAQTIRVYGTPTVIAGKVTSLADEGKMYEEILLAQEQILIAKKEAELVDKKKRESDAAVHKVIADTFWNYGSCTYTIDEGGLSNVAQNWDSNYPDFEPLSSIQATMAKEQASGYSYNAWANALTGSANMIAAGMSSGYVPTATADDALTTWKHALNQLAYQVRDPYAP